MDKTKDFDSSGEEKEEKHMAVSMAVIPTLRGEAATSILETIKISKIKPYSKETKLGKIPLSGISCLQFPLIS